MYTVSFWAYLTAGSISSGTVSLNSGTSAAIPDISTTGFTRISAEVTSGTAATGLTFTYTSNTGDAILAVVGFQAEQGTLSSYIRTGTSVQSRSADLVSVPYTIPLASQTWSMTWDYVGTGTATGETTVFNNGLASTSEFKAYYTGTSLFVDMGSTTIEIPAATTVPSIGVTYDGTTLKTYFNGFLTQSDVVAGTTALGTVLYIGNDNGTNALNAQLLNFKVWDATLTLDEIKHMARSV